MKLPNLDQAVVQKEKITAYLLSEENSGGKVAFFSGLGFSSARWDELRDALLLHATAHEVVTSSPSSHGTKYIIEGALQAPDGRQPQVRTVWIVDAGHSSPRFVTAYPL